MERAVVLRTGAALLTAAAFVAAGDYVIHHPKNANAPLQPPAVDDIALRSATPAPHGSASTAPRGSATPTPRGTQPPRITLQPGVRATALPGVTYTHVS